MPRSTQAGRASSYLLFSGCLSPSLGKREVLGCVCRAVEKSCGNQRHRIIFQVLQVDTFWDSIFLERSSENGSPPADKASVLAPHCPLQFDGQGIL